MPLGQLLKPGKLLLEQQILILEVLEVNLNAVANGNQPLLRAPLWKI
jgi:hypothetical protein